MSANDKFGLRYGDYIYGSILSYENEVLQSMFMNKASDLEDTFVNDRYVDGMHAVPPPMTGNYMPSGPDVEIDYSKFTYDLKQTLVDESDSKPIEYASCESNSSVEITTSMPEPVENTPKIVWISTGKEVDIGLDGSVTNHYVQQICYSTRGMEDSYTLLTSRRATLAIPRNLIGQEDVKDDLRAQKDELEFVMNQGLRWEA
nr:hypothetical protein [Tanacetum cinerariifolium]